MNSASDSVFIIAEAGVNHNGSLTRAIELCTIARDCGANAVKFQTWQTDLLILPFTPQANYQRKNFSRAKDQYSMLKELELSYSQFERIKLHCDKIGIEFLSTPDEIESLRFLVNDLGLGTIKVGSGELGNTPFLREVARLAKHVILSTGMSSLEEIEMTVNNLGRPAPEELTLLHCTSSYPCPIEYVNLRVIPKLMTYFPYSVGYSDHTVGIAVSLAAAAIGAKVLEKHFTQSKSLSGPDHACSLEPHELAQLVEGVHTVSMSLGTGQKAMQPVEQDVRMVATKIILASQPIEAGVPFSDSNIILLRAGVSGINGFDWDTLIGKKAKRAYSAYEPIDTAEIVPT